MNFERLNAWLERIVTDITEEGAISQLVLWAAPGDDDAVIDTIRLAGAESKTVESLAQHVWDTADQDAASRPPVPIRYVLTATRADRDTPEAQFAWMVRGRSGSSLAFAGEPAMDPPTERGGLGLAFRTMESQNRLIALMVDGSVGHLIRQNQSLERRNEFLERREVARSSLDEQLRDRKAERDLSLAREEAKARRHEKLLHELCTIAPLVIAHLVAKGAPLGRDVATAAMRDGVIGRILEDLDEKQLEVLVAGLTERQRMAFFELYKSYREDRAAKAKDEPELVRKKPPAPHGEGGS